MRTQKILTCDADGNLTLTPETYESFYDEIIDDLFEIEDRMVRLRKLLDFADSCRTWPRDFNLDGWAYCAYLSVFRSISWRSAGEEHDLLERAVGGLTGLSTSDDELMWERTSQIVGDYHIWKMEQERQK